MRLIRVYELLRGDYWTSPEALVGSILSGDDLSATHYGGYTVGSRSAINRAVEEAKKLFWESVFRGLKNVLWVGTLVAGVAWPVLKIPKDVQWFFFALSGTAFVVAVLKLIETCRRRYKFGRFDLSELEHVAKPNLAPPPMAHRETEIKMPRLRYALASFVVGVLLNCMVWASPMYPAKIGRQYLVADTFVAPWVTWESTEKVQQGDLIAIVAAPTTEQIYIARATYVIHRVGFAESERGWEDWTQNRYSHVAGQISESLMQSMPDEIVVDEEVSWLVETWEMESDEGTPLEWLRNVVINNFQARYEGVFELISFQIDIEHISLKDYRKEMQR